MWTIYKHDKHYNNAIQLNMYFVSEQSAKNYLDYMIRNMPANFRYYMVSEV